MQFFQTANCELWKQVAWPKMLYERESTEHSSPAQPPPSPPPFTPFPLPPFFVSFGSAGDGRFCVGPIMLILVSAVVILRHDHERFKGRKFMKGSKAQ